MLETLLRLVAEHGTASSRELARQLAVSPELVAPMLEALAQHRYLLRVVQGCSVPCERCPLHSACLYRTQPRVWMLTSKGERLLRGNSP